LRNAQGSLKPGELQTGKQPTWYRHSSYQWHGVSKFGQIFKGGSFPACFAVSLTGYG
jgi:hypothetical protein